MYIVSSIIGTDFSISPQVLPVNYSVIRKTI